MSVSPSFGPVAGGTRITVKGALFNQETDWNETFSVDVGGAKCLLRNM